MRIRVFMGACKFNDERKKKWFTLQFFFFFIVLHIFMDALGHRREFVAHNVNRIRKLRVCLGTPIYITKYKKKSNNREGIFAVPRGHKREQSVCV